MSVHTNTAFAKKSDQNVLKNISSNKISAVSVPTIELSVNSDGVTVLTTIGYRNTATVGLDPGFDVGNFGGSSFDIYTHLVDGSSTNDFTYQSLPDSNYESMIIPVGLTANSGKEITFSTNNSNLPSDLQVVLEDRDLNKFIILDGVNTYTIVLSNNENGIGRFYLHTRFQAIWSGNTSNVWNDNTNWSGNILPLSTSNITIPNTSTSPIIENLITQVNELTIENTSAIHIASNGGLIVNSDFNNNGSTTITSSSTNSGTLLIKGTSNGMVTYERSGLLANKWSIISAPVSGQSIKEFVENSVNDIRKNTTVSPNRIAIGYYDDSQPSGAKWVYYTTDDITTNTLTFEKGRSYIFSRATDGAVTFTGTVTTSNTVKTVVASEWNAIGNPYTTYFPVNENSGTNFIQDNISNFDPSYVGIYTWDNTQNKYVVNSLISAAKSLTPGQGFFVKTGSAVSSMTFNESLRSTQSLGGTFNKGTNTSPSIELFVNNNKVKLGTKIAFRKDASLGLDPGYDLGNFDGANLDIYTRLVDNSSTKNFTYQTLPLENTASYTIPVGVNAEAGSDIEFSVESSSLSADIEIYLEDKLTNQIKKLDVSSTYKIKTHEKENGIGRFYLHIKSATLGFEDQTTKNINVYLTNTSELIIEGINNEIINIVMYDLSGVEVFSSKLQKNENNRVKLPSLNTGIYVTKITIENSIIHKKILIQK